MTENKRYSFNWERGHLNFWDNHCDLADCYLTCEDVIDRLNELNEENKRLQFQCNLLQEEANEFHRGARENANMVGQLKEENEQLKQHNTELINKIDFLERIIDGDME